jgi:hypothetical protein
LASGLSPALPWLLLIAGLLWWAWYSLAGMALLDQRRPHLPSATDLTSTTELKQLGRWHLTEDANLKLLAIAKPFSFDPRVYMPILLSGAIALMIVDHQHPVQSLEGIAFDRAYAFVFAFVILWLLGTLFRLAVIWLECRRLLIALDSIPLRRSFRWLTGFSWRPIWRVRGSFLQDSFRTIEREMDSLQNLSNVLEQNQWSLGPDLQPPTALNEEEATPPDTQRKSRSEQMRDAVDKNYKAATQDKVPFVPAFLKKVINDFAGRICRKKGQVTPDGPNHTMLASQLIESFEGLQNELAKICARALNFLSTQWAKEGRTQMQENSQSRSHKSASAETQCRMERPEEKDRRDLPLETRLAEEFVCLVYVNFILSVLMRMRSLVMAAIGMFVFLLLSVGSYPFEPKQTMYSLLILLFLLIVGFVAVVYAQMHRDSTLSRITDTTPGELGFDFWIRLAGFTAVPLLSLLLAQFPGVNNFLFSWLEPALRGWK